MAFDVPESQYGKIQKWVKETIQAIPFIKGVAIYDSDFFINSSINLPAIALQRGELVEETDSNEKCVGEDNVKSTLTITLHIPPTDKDTLDPVLYYFEETVYKTLLQAYLTGNPPSNLNYFTFNRSKISNLFVRKNHTAFSNISQIMFDIGYTV